MTFLELQLAQPLLAALTDAGYLNPTPIQEQAIPAALEGQDIMGSAQTGTGKTAAYLLPVLHRLYEQRQAEQPAHPSSPAMAAQLAVNAAPTESPEAVRPGRKWMGKVVRPAPHRHAGHQHGNHMAHGRHTAIGPKPKTRALVLAPTRELASQITDSAHTYGRHTGLRTGAIYGGVSQFHQVRQLQQGIDVLVATPGRLLDLYDQGHIDFGHIQMLVLDEADRMLDLGFMPDLQRIISLLPPERQTLFFSATVPPAIRRLADSLLTSPAVVSVASESTSADTVEQHLYHVARNAKQDLLLHLLQDAGNDQTLVFTKTKYGADILTDALCDAGISARSIHGDKSQHLRQAALNAFKQGRVQVLVATDVAARGIDVDRLAFVVNYDLPMEAETYVHRIGRTGRAGNSGKALSFCEPAERNLLRGIVRLLKREIPMVAEHPFAIAPPDSQEGQGRGGNRRSFNGRGGQGGGRGGYQGNRGGGGGFNARRPARRSA